MKRVLLWLLMLPIIAAAQTKKPTTTSDLARLVAKYKDGQDITIYTPSETFTAHIEIKTNDAGKPCAVIMYGTYASSNAIRSLIEQQTAQKEKSGYKYITGTGEAELYYEGHHTFKVQLYQKGTQYAKYGYEEDSSMPGLIGYKPPYFYFEVGDLKRQGTGGNENFTF